MIFALLKTSGGQAVPHSSAKVLFCNTGQAGSYEQRIAAFCQRTRLAYQINRRYFKKFNA